MFRAGDEGGIPGTCDPRGQEARTLHPWGSIRWNSAPESMGDGDTYGWRGTCEECGAAVVEWLVCDGAEEVEGE